MSRGEQGVSLTRVWFVHIFPVPPYWKPIFMQPSKKLYNILKLKKIAFKRCDGAMVARQIADLEAASSSLAHSSLDSSFFLFFPFLFFLFFFFSLSV
jgi:hypothetical protein